MLALGLRAAHAEDVLQIPPSCGSGSELAREVDALRAREAPGTPRPDVRLAPSDGGDRGYVLEIDLPEGTRTLRDPDCRALFRAAIVIAALGHELPVEGEAAAAPASSAVPIAAPALTQPPPAAAPRPSSSPTPVQPREADGRGPRERRAGASRPRAQAEGSAFFQIEAAHGVVPSWSAALSAGAAWRRGLWGMRGWFGYLTPNSAHSEDAAVRIQALDLAVGAELWPLRRLGLGLGADLFFLRGQGVNVQGARVDWTVQPAPHLAVRAKLWAGSRGALELTGRAVWSPQPSRFRLENGGTVYEAEAFAFQLGLAGSLQFL
jgi:hypothetical protein